MVDFSAREGIMREWGKWCKYIADGGGGSWPRDAFESLLDYFDEQIGHLKKSNMNDIKDVFDSITCLAVEGPELHTKVWLMEAIKKEAIKGHDLCKDQLTKSTEPDNTEPCYICKETEGYHEGWCSRGTKHRP